MSDAVRDVTKRALYEAELDQLRLENASMKDRIAELTAAAEQARKALQDARGAIAAAVVHLEGPTPEPPANRPEQAGEGTGASGRGETVVAFNPAFVSEEYARTIIPKLEEAGLATLVGDTLAIDARIVALVRGDQCGIPPAREPDGYDEDHDDRGDA